MSDKEIIQKIDSKNCIINEIDDEILDIEPFDNKFIITDSNKSDIIKYFEGEIRDSFEYKWLIDMCKKVLKMKKSVFFEQYSLENGMKLEFHHHPFTLYDYTEAVINKHIEEHGDNYVYENEVQKEVALLHHEFKVGLTPLDPTSHSQVHDDALDIHPDYIEGNYDQFYREYYNYIPETTRNKYNEYINKYKNSGPADHPDIYKYKPTIIKASNKLSLTVKSIDTLLIDDKMNKVNNKDIQKVLESYNKGEN